MTVAHLRRAAQRIQDRSEALNSAIERHPLSMTDWDQIARAGEIERWVEDADAGIATHHWILTFDPAVAAPLVAWLRTTADYADSAGCTPHTDAVAFARAVLMCREETLDRLTQKPVRCQVLDGDHEIRDLGWDGPNEVHVSASGQAWAHVWEQVSEEWDDWQRPLN